MKYIGHYFPFLIISAVLYGLFFYYNAQLTVVSPILLDSGKQSMQVQFLEVQQALPQAQPANKVKPMPGKEQQTPKNIPLPATTVLTQKESQIKIASKALHKSIYEHRAESDALLKSEQFKKDFHLDLPVTPITSKQSTKKVNKAQKVAGKAASHNKNSKHKKKPKRVFKVSPVNNTVAQAIKKQGVLQEAIVVSGKKPLYPNRAVLRNQQGRVVVKLTVTINGKAKNPKIITSSGSPILDNSVLDFISKELFMPAHKGDEKITTEQFFSFRFELK